jgi:hypothetical protein
MRIIGAFIFATVLSGCVSAPLSRDPAVLLADTSSRDVVRLMETVDTPFETAYRNLLHEARLCWTRASAVPVIGATWKLETESDPLQKEAAIYLLAGTLVRSDVTMSIEVKGQGSKTLIRAAAIQPRTGTMIGTKEIVDLPKWARGEKTECSSPDLIF